MRRGGKKIESADAWRDVKPFKGANKPKKDHLQKDELIRLQNACEPRAFRNLVTAAVLTGCRYGELCRLTVGDFDLDDGRITVTWTKTGEDREVYLSEDAFPVL